MIHPFHTEKHSISNKITRSIIMVAFLSSLIIGLTGIIGAAIVSSLANRMYTHDMKPLTNIYLAEKDLLTLRMNFRNMVINRESAQAYLDENVKIYADMENQIKMVGKHLSSAEDRANYQKIQADLKTYKEQGYDVAMKYIQNGQFEAESEELYSTGNTISVNFDNDINRYFTLSNQEAQQRNQMAAVILFAIIVFILAVIIFTIRMAVVTGRRIAGKISAPIRQVVEAAESISAGNLDVHLDIASDDETGLLAASFRKVVTALQRLESDVETLISAALEGNLDKRADAQRHEGKYREIVEGVNKMLDTVKEPLDVASGFIDGLAEGEPQAEIENTYCGYYAVLIDNLNKVRRSLATLFEQSQMLEQAGRDGKLDVRGDTEKLHGLYARIVEGVNSTFDSIKKPLDAAAEFIDGLAAGTVMPPMENAYRGYYAKLIDNLNGVRNSLMILLDESRKLAQAGQSGQLDVRGDAAAVRGGYAEIISGFNHTLDAVLTPLEESFRILSRFARNDYSDPMADTYPGAFREFAGSVNTVRERLLSVQDAIERIGQGDVSRLDELRQIGKRSDNDRIMPAVINACQTIRDLIDESERLAAAAYEGRLDVRGDAERFSGSYRPIIEGMNRTMESVSAPIRESSAVLQRLADGDLTVSMAGEYQGAYNQIKENLNQAVCSFRNLLSEIAEASDQVAAGSRQVSDGSQSLSQGATEQASAMEELNSSIAEIAARTKQNAEHAGQANSLVIDTRRETAQGMESMGRMTEAMRNISESSVRISKINGTIDDIAFQTNILALNAAVEAARAGQYGRGFAVVAEEVRNLAVKSADAARETAELIEDSIRKIQDGTRTAGQTADSFSRIAESIRKVTEYVGNIAAASSDQASSLSQIDRGLAQVSTVVQTNSATAEESAASSEELSGQADTLKQLIARFSL